METTNIDTAGIINSQEYLKTLANKELLDILLLNPKSFIANSGEKEFYSLLKELSIPEVIIDALKRNPNTKTNKLKLENQERIDELFKALKNK